MRAPLTFSGSIKTAMEPAAPPCLIRVPSLRLPPKRTAKRPVLTLFLFQPPIPGAVFFFSALRGPAMLYRYCSLSIFSCSGFLIKSLLFLTPSVLSLPPPVCFYIRPAAFRCKTILLALRLPCNRVCPRSFTTKILRALLLPVHPPLSPKALYCPDLTRGYAA